MRQKPKICSFFVPELIEAQRVSFLRLLKTGIPAELQKRNPMTFYYAFHEHATKDTLHRLASKRVGKDHLRPIKYELYRFGRFETNECGVFEFCFHPNYKLIPPQGSVTNAILNGQTYSAQLYVPIEVKTSRQETLLTKWLLLGNLPIMTNRGHFIINGSPRVILHQLVRSPGVYYHLNFDDKHRKSAYADLICHRGVWLRMEIDKKARMWVKMKRLPKIPIVNFLQCFGMTHPSLVSQLNLDQLPKFRTTVDRKKKRPDFEKFFFQKLYDEPFVKTDMLPQWPYPMGNQALITPTEARHYNAHFIKTFLPVNSTRRLPHYLINERFKFSFFLPLPKHMFKNPELDWEYNLLKKRWDPIFSEWELGYLNFQTVHSWVTLYHFVKKRFLNPKAYDLSEAGRVRLNRQLGLKKPQTQTTLTLDDLICMANSLVWVYLEKVAPDNIDHLKNRRVRCSGELIQNQIGVGLLRVDELAKKKPLPTRQPFIKKNMKSVRRLINTKPFNGALKEFFNSHPLSQFLDQTNALAELTHKRRLSSLGPGGITRETAGMKIRSIHPSHYGRICPIETPEGPNAGLVNSLTAYARINAFGFIETPFHKVNSGQIVKEGFVWYLSANQDDNKACAPPDLKTTPLGTFASNRVPVRLGDEFTNTDKTGLDFMSVSRIQMISVATSLIPFLEHDDANRALMGSNMQRQSVPLISPQRPIVGTGLEGRVISDSGHALEAQRAGLVIYASAEKIQILSFVKNKDNLRSYSSVKHKSLPTNQHSNNAVKNQLKDTLTFKPHIFTYNLQGYQRSNQNTCLTQRPLVFEGEWVEKGTLLVDCASSAYGELAVGKKYSNRLSTMGRL